MHGDEAVHAFKFRELWDKGIYRYDPNEYHGPSLYYATLPVVKLLGRPDFAGIKLSDYRLVTALFGAALLLLLPLLSDGIGRRAVLVSAALFAISPAFVFYSRYYIQEMLLAFFTLAAITFGWRYFKSRKIGWALAAGISAGMMIASKETAVLTFGAALIAFALSFWRFHTKGHKASSKGFWMHLAIAVVCALAVAALFVSGFFSHPAGTLDYLRSYFTWTARADETNLHRHPWYYYLQILIWTHRDSRPVWNELLIVVLSLVGWAAAIFPRRFHLPENSAPLPFFLGSFTFFLTLAYSLIPYKTPWCLLSFLLGMILLAGVGAVTLVRITPWLPLKALACLILLTAGVQLAHLSWLTSFVYPTDGGNPSVYAQPSPDAVTMGRKVMDIAHASPMGNSMVVYVISRDNYYWPLPWYLRDLKNVGYWTSMPEDLNVPVITASYSLDDTLSKRLNNTHVMTGYYGLRPGVFYEVWVRMDIWKDYLATRKNVKVQIGE
jgi:uncharacterized protein (TIGR03663 family)